MFFSSTAYAHALYDRLPAGSFVVKWAWDPALILFLILGVLYWRGLKAFRGPLPVKKWQIASFYFGITALVVSMLPPIDPLSDQLFFVHMIQHLMITNIGVPFMMLGVPFFIVIRGISPWSRRHFYFPLVRQKGLQRAFQFISRPLPALMLFQANFFFWHVPYWYNLALLNDYYHLLQHGTFSLSSILLWRNIIDPHPMKAPLPLPARILFLVSIMATSIGLSVALTFADRVWYAYEGRPIPGWWTWGHHIDQHLGGLIMWVPAEFMDLIAMTAVFFVWVHREQVKEKLQQKLMEKKNTPPITN
jgi:cytochrome c oxidase assembly factor CtaG